MEEIARKNETFIRELTNKDSFMLDWYEGAVLPEDHPHYYDNRVEVHIRRMFNNCYGEIAFERDSCQISDEIVANLYNYIEANIDKLIKIALNQTVEMYEGVSESLNIKYKSIYLDISELNAPSDEEKTEIARIKSDIKAIICVQQ